jgi:hypothetical protein
MSATLVSPFDVLTFASTPWYPDPKSLGGWGYTRGFSDTDLSPT